MSRVLSAPVWLKDTRLVVGVASDRVASSLTGAAGVSASANEVGCLSNYLILAVFLFVCLFPLHDCLARESWQPRPPSTTLRLFRLPSCVLTASF